jgi:hypothetical protein
MGFALEEGPANAVALFQGPVLTDSLGLPPDR